MLRLTSTRPVLMPTCRTIVDKAIGFATTLFESSRGRVGRYDLEGMIDQYVRFQNSP